MFKSPPGIYTHTALLSENHIFEVGFGVVITTRLEMLKSKVGGSGLGLDSTFDVSFLLTHFLKDSKFWLMTQVVSPGPVLWEAAGK